VLQSVSVWAILRYVAVCCGVLRCVAVYCGMLRYIAVCCGFQADRFVDYQMMTGVMTEVYQQR
jgi:hypothetical protein